MNSELIEKFSDPVRTKVLSKASVKLLVRAATERASRIDVFPAPFTPEITFIPLANSVIEVSVWFRKFDMERLWALMYFSEKADQ